MATSTEILEELKSLENKRKNGEIGVREFYMGLLKILQNLGDTLIHEEISEEQIKKQIPLVMAFLKSQLDELKKRGH